MLARPILAAGILTAVLALAGCSSTVDVIPTGYEMDDPSGTSLLLYVPGGVGDEIAEARVTSQDDNQVQVEVTVRQGDTNRPSLLITLQAHISLESPLGERTVVDQQGHEIPRRR